MSRLAIEGSEMVREELGRERVGEPLHREEEAAAEQDERQVRTCCQVGYMERFTRLDDCRRVEERHRGRARKSNC